MMGKVVKSFEESSDNAEGNAKELRVGCHPGLVALMQNLRLSYVKE